MPTDVTINDVSGQTPFNVYICNTGYTTCVYINTITSGDLPYTFEVPSLFTTAVNFTLRVVDDNSCEINEVIYV